MRLCSALPVVAVIVCIHTAIGSARVAVAKPVKVLRDLACTSCHLDDRPTRFMYPSFDAFSKSPPPPPTGCVQCHVSNFAAASSPNPAGWLPLATDAIERIRGFHAYVDAPALVTSVSLVDPSGRRRLLARFTACGLERFLSNPLPRRGAARQSMFPLEPGRLRTLLAALAPELESCAAADARGPSLEQVERGRQLFVGRACVTCHAGDGQGPRLRLGFPLQGRAYFRARVRKGAGSPEAPQIWQRRWRLSKRQLVATTAGAVEMPAHADMSDADLDSLYAYTSSDRSDVPLPMATSPRSPSIAVPASIRLSLYREVQRRVFDTSCRHCHSPDIRDQSLIENVFGESPGSAPVELPMTRLGVAPNDRLRKLLSPGAGCSDSPLLLRLKARAVEWTGRASAGAPRGMPLTMPPIDRDALRLVEVWSAAGCPSDHGDLCDVCPAPRG